MSYFDAIEIAATFTDDDDIDTSTATSTSAQNLGAGDLKGRIGPNRMDAYSPFVTTRAITVSTSASANAYNITDSIVFRGKDSQGNNATQLIRLLATSGNETVQSLGGLAQVTNVQVPAMLTTAGFLKFGVGDLMFEPVMASRLVATTAGIYKIRTAYGLDRDITLAANAVVDLRFSRVRAAHAVFPFAIYVPQANET